MSGYDEDRATLVENSRIKLIEGAVTPLILEATAYPRGLQDALAYCLQNNVADGATPVNQSEVEQPRDA